MAANSETKDRQVVPRWRTFRETLAAGELSSAAVQKSKQIDATEFILERENGWQENKAIPFALDLVSAATILGKTDKSIEAAEFILENGNFASETGKRLARGLLGIQQQEATIIPLQSRIQIHDGLKNLKANRILQPKNAFVWVDLARLYTLLGQNEQARQALTIALQLAPTERFVVRSTARFLHHIDEYDEAVVLLQKNSRTPHDPWLIAAEIAASGAAERSPRFAKLGSAILQDTNLSPFHTSELASALGTLDMSAGKHRHANQQFRKSLRKPTQNALAQAVWASRRTGLGQISAELLAETKAIEAQTLDHANKREWQQVMDGAAKWGLEEGFSPRPPGLASCVATSLLNKPELGEEIAHKGLEANPRHPGLVNNKAFAQILQGKAEEALKTLALVDIASAPRRLRICLIATYGLAYFRLGNEQEGQRLYRVAIDNAKEPEELGLKTLASLYLAREEAMRGNKQAFIDFKKAYEAAEKQQETTNPAIAENLARDVEQAAARHGVKLEITKQIKPIIVERDFFIPISNKKQIGPEK